MTVQLEEITPSVLGITGPVRPGPGLEMATRAVALGLGRASAIVSPLSFDDDTASRIESALGPPAHLIAPNLFHHLFLGRARLRWPGALTWAPQGLEAKQPSVVPARLLDEHEGDPNWPAEITALPVEGAPGLGEWALLHKPSATLVLTDLVFNRPEGHGLLARLFFRLAGTHDRCAVSRLVKILVKDRDAFRASCRRILDLDFQRVVVAHGDVLEGAGARDALAQALGVEAVRGR